MLSGEKDEAIEIVLSCGDGIRRGISDSDDRYVISVPESTRGTMVLKKHSNLEHEKKWRTLRYSTFQCLLLCGSTTVFHLDFSLAKEGLNRPAQG